MQNTITIQKKKTEAKQYFRYYMPHEWFDLCHCDLQSMLGQYYLRSNSGLFTAEGAETRDVHGQGWAEASLPRNQKGNQFLSP